MLNFIRGDMFATPADIRVNTVNCVGVMGAGVALAFKTRYPDMFVAYKKKCDAGQMRPGELDIWRTLTEWVINFPTKRHWREKSRYEDIEAGLIALKDYLAKQGSVRVSLPALGCGHGGLEWSRVSEMIRTFLQDLEAEILVFEPGDSVAAGERVASAKRSQSAAVELSAETLGAWRSERPQCLREWGIEKMFVLGNVELLTQPWLSVILSPKPKEREETAAVACIEAISHSDIIVSFRYGGRTSRLLCEAALSRAARVVLWASEGIDYVKPPKSIQAELTRGRLAIASIAKPRERWSHLSAERVCRLQCELAQAVLITDPTPELPPTYSWWQGSCQPSLFYVRYGNAESAAIDRLRHEGAHAVSRDAQTGLPKTAPVLAALGVSA